METGATGSPSSALQWWPCFSVCIYFSLLGAHPEGCRVVYSGTYDLEALANSPLNLHPTPPPPPNCFFQLVDEAGIGEEALLPQSALRNGGGAGPAAQEGKDGSSN